MARPLKVGISHGDINGISYEIIIKALDDEMFTELCTPVIFGSAKLMAYFRKSLNAAPLQIHQVASAAEAKDGAVNLVNITDEELKVEPGQPTAEAGAAALLSLEKAVEALAAGEIDVLVTAPINKNTIQCDDFRFAGHTEYLADRIGEEGDKPLMILFDENLKVALVTTHLPISRVAQAITREGVADTIGRFDASLRRDFRVERPRIAVLSLNPHAGDAGLLGDEEQTVIGPALADCLEKGILAFGPFAADGFFSTAAYRNFDGVVAMYHDQGLAPFKALAGQGGVNFTAGLPFVRTSPDHGTGYDIAGKDMADPQSMRQAIYAAIDIARARRDFDRASANPLRKQYVERGADRTVDLTKEETD